MTSRNRSTIDHGETIARASNAYARAMTGSIFLTVFFLRLSAKGIDLLNILLILAAVASLAWSSAECKKASAALTGPERNDPVKTVIATLFFGTSVSYAVWTSIYSGLTFLGALAAIVALVSLMCAGVISQGLKKKLGE